MGTSMRDSRACISAQPPFITQILQRAVALGTEQHLIEGFEFGQPEFGGSHITAVEAKTEIGSAARAKVPCGIGAAVQREGRGSPVINDFNDGPCIQRPCGKRDLLSAVADGRHLWSRADLLKGKRFRRSPVK